MTIRVEAAEAADPFYDRDPDRALELCDHFRLDQVCVRDHFPVSAGRRDRFCADVPMNFLEEKIFHNKYLKEKEAVKKLASRSA